MSTSISHLLARRVPPAAPARAVSGPTPADMISFAAASPDPTTFPTERMLEVLRSALEERPVRTLDYDISAGSAALRETIAARLAARAGVAVSADQLTITQGAAGAIEAAAAAVLDEGEVVFVEEFTYHTGLYSFRYRGADVVVCPSDGEGLLVDELASLVARARSDGRRPRMVYFAANFGNPSGITMSIPRREQLAALAQREQLVLLQDDTYSQIRWVTPEPPPLTVWAPDHTIVVGSCSKVLAPGLRIGWSWSSPGFAEALVAMRTDLGVSPLLQRTAEHLLAAPWFDEHLADVIALQHEKKERLRSALAPLSEHLASVSDPEGGIYLWVTLREGTVNELLPHARSHGVMVLPQTHFSPFGLDGPGFRVGFGNVPMDVFDEGVHRLGLALHDLRAARHGGTAAAVAGRG